MSVLDSETPETNTSKENSVWKKPSTERLITGGLWYNIFDIVGSIANVLFIMIISQIPVSDSALLAEIDTFRSFLLAFSTLGFVGAGAKFFSEYLGRNDLHQAKLYAAASIKYNLLYTGIPTVLIAVIFAIIIPNNRIEQIGFIMLIFTVLFDRFRSCFDIVLLGYQRYDLWSAAYFIPYILSWIIGGLLIAPVGVLGAVGAFMGANIASFILSVWFTKKIAPFPIQDILHYREEIPLFGKILKFNLLYALANLAFSLLIGSLVITETSVLGTFTDLETSTYYVITAYLTLYIGIFGIVNPINQAISEAHAMRNMELISNYIKTVVKFPLLMAIPVTIVLVIMGPDIIEAFNGDTYVNIGYFFLIVFLPGYAFGSFASKYDNVLAGIGKPEIPMIPWLIGLFVAATGILTTIWIPTEIYPFSKVFPDVSLRFAVAIGSLAFGLLIAGIWIVIITFKVFDVKIPKEYISRPLVVSLIVAGFYLVLTSVFEIKQFFIDNLGDFTGNFMYIACMIVLLLTIFIPLLIICGGISKEDGRFILRIIGTKSSIRKILLPMIRIINWCFNHQIRKAEETHWITREEKDELFNQEVISVEIVPKSSHIYDIRINNNSDLPLYEISLKIKINGLEQIHLTQFNEILNSGTKWETNIIIEEKESSSEEINIKNLHFYIQSSTKPSLKNKTTEISLWSKCFDYRLQWNFEKEFVF